MGHMTRFDSIDLIENIFKNAFRPIGFETGRPLAPNSDDARQEARLIRMDVHENDQEYRISAELSGIRKEDVNIAIDGNRVMLSAECKREEAADNKGGRMLCGERFYGQLRRSIQLPEEIDDEQAQAKYADGLLELVLPKKRNKGTKRLEIQS